MPESRVWVARGAASIGGETPEIASVPPPSNTIQWIPSSASFLFFYSCQKLLQKCCATVGLKGGKATFWDFDSAKDIKATEEDTIPHNNIQRPICGTYLHLPSFELRNIIGMKATKDINSCAGIQNNPENVLRYFDTKQPELIEKRLFRLGVGNDSRCKKPVTHRGGPSAVVKNLLLPF